MMVGIVSIASWRMSPTVRLAVSAFDRWSRAIDASAASRVGAQERGVAERDPGVRGQDLEDALVPFVEHAVAEARQDDDADHVVADDHRYGEHRLEEVVLGAGDRDGDIDLPRIRGEERLPPLRHGTGDALARAP